MSATSPVHAPRSHQAGRLLGTSRRTRLLAGGTLVVACALAVPLLATSLTPKPAQVLSAVHDLPPGTVITSADLAVVSGSGPSSALISAADRASLIGRTVRIEVPAGALLNTADLGSFPPVGQSIVPVAVKPGQYPADLQVGQPVAIYSVAGTTTGTQPTSAPNAAVSGTVTEISPLQDDGAVQTVIDLAVPNASVSVVAQAQAVVLVAEDSQGDLP